MNKIKLVVALLILLLTTFASIQYTGNLFYYLIFTVSMNALFLAGFRRKRIFFDTFIGIFFWLGFWIKFSVRIAFFESHFVDPTGGFDFTPAAMDEAMLVSTLGTFGLLMATVMRQRMFFDAFHSVPHSIFKNLTELYRGKRKLILISFVLFYLFVAYLNISLRIYQRGMVAGTHLPFSLNGVFSWLLLFGLTSIATVILNLEFILKKNKMLVFVMAFFENLSSSVSMLSRGMILNSSALLFALVAYDEARIFIFSFAQKVKILSLFALIFASSVVAVNYTRLHYFYRHLPPEEQAKTMQNMKMITGPLFIDRWVGIEGVMSIVGYPKKDFGLFSRALSETFEETKTTFYDIEIAKTDWSRANFLQNHFISLPGILAFFYYPGSLLFLFVAMFLVGLSGAGIEYFVFKFSGGNLFLCSLMAQVAAYRFAHFGYVPRQSYLLFGTLFVNVLLFFMLEKFLDFIWKKRNLDAHSS